jgi:hypothetical protein
LRWDLTSFIWIRQSNNIEVTLKLQGTTVVTGRAEYMTRSNDKVTGDVYGNMFGDKFDAQIRWNNGDVTVYSGEVVNGRRLQGSSYSVRNQAAKIPWSGSWLRCAEQGPAPAAPKPVTSAPAATPKPANPAAAPLKPVPPKPVKPNNARPPNWDVGGEWQLSQSDGKTVTLTLKDNEGDFRGSATVGKPNAPGYTHGKVEGFVTGDTFSARVTWAATLVTKADWVADYSGTIGPQGMILGSVNRGTPSQQSWSSLTEMKRTDGNGETADSATPPRFNRMNRLRGVGSAPGTATPADDQPAQSGAGVPRIAASPTKVTIPSGRALGSTTLTWDGGADHPYAEVWVEEDGGDATKIVEQGKGSRTVNVEPGRTYKYILTDAGEELATVTVRAK